MIDVQGTAQVGDVKAYTTSGRGLNVEELADMALNKIIYVADTATSDIKEQVHMFKEHLRPILITYMHQAIKSDRTTLYNNLRGAGHPEVADIVLRI